MTAAAREEAKALRRRAMLALLLELTEARMALLMTSGAKS